ncbi:MAG TPA: hypothetical protein VLJ83_09105, partial [Gemmatimonadaceae bacterium]|nr:hypothetical protein [Gemmatimonadaceae bacterium]
MLAPIDKTLRGTLPPVLAKDIAPLINGVMYPGSQYGNGAMYYPRTDPVLSNLVGSDEREFARMIRTSSAISGAITQRKRGLSSQGYRVVKGKSRSAAASLLREWAEAFIAAIPRFPILRMEVLDAIYYGWRPVELQWSSDDFRFKGRPQIGLKNAVAHDPWHFIFTIERELSFAATYQGGTDPIEDPLRFMVATAGSTQSPYGKSELQNLWLLYFVAKQFEKMSGIAMQRALGLLKAVRKSSPGSITPAPSSAVIDSELRGVLDKLNSNNILVESQNYSL